MPLKSYEQNGRLLNVNFMGNAGAGLSGYRGELVLIEGDVADSAGHRKPPESVIEQAVLLAEGEKIQMFCGLVRELAELEHFIPAYASDLASEVTPLFFVVNAAKEMKINVNGMQLDVIPLAEGLVWSELTDLLGLEKGDFKGQSSGEKITTVYKSLKDFRSGFDVVDWANALNHVTAVKRETRGAL